MYIPLGTIEEAMFETEQLVFVRSAVSKSLFEETMDES